MECDVCVLVIAACGENLRFIQSEEIELSRDRDIVLRRNAARQSSEKGTRRQSRRPISFHVDQDLGSRIRFGRVATLSIPVHP